VLGGGRLEPGMHVLTKPFPIETLGATIKALIDAHAEKLAKFKKIEP
jgi:hypothetical protein